MKYAVLCVDDEKAIVELLSFQLRKYFKPTTTWIEAYTIPSEVESNVQELMSYGVDILFLIVDYHMPVMNGATLVKNLKKNYPELICIMLTGQANDEVLSQLVEEELLYAVIKKPWSEDALVNKIKPFIEKSEA
jgi:CheY-like chemotaxis protein